MTSQKLRYSKEEFAKRGKALYEDRIRAQVEEDNYGKIVAIDIETGAFEVAENSLSASERLRDRRPEAQAWFVRIGHQTVHRIGSASTVIPQ
ncbi:MAG: hypothetical protein WA885_17315 [Phormidesmis sp.]